MATVMQRCDRRAERTPVVAHSLTGGPEGGGRRDDLNKGSLVHGEDR